ncbi:two-component system, cell cycle response regulator [Gammaproteobacteria bacterium]
MSMITRRSRILIIDDMPANLRTLGAVLSKEFELQIAKSGAMGLALAEQSPPDLILLDVMMPEMDGYETCRRFKSDARLQTIPIIFVTAMVESDAEYSGLVLGAADYITKPINVEIASQRIRNLLERERLRKEVEVYRDYLEELVQARTLALSIAQAHVSNLEGIAYYDPLTGIPNRRLMIDHLNQSIAHAKRMGRLLAVCYFDLDGFKPINDQLGHDAGDQLLCEITRRLQAILREYDTLARVGGDEFVLLLSNLEKDTECYDILERVLTTIRMPFIIKNQFIIISASLGLTIYPYDDATVDDLISHADQAMYRAKQEGKNRFSVYPISTDL